MKITVDELNTLSQTAEPFKYIIDPDEPVFAAKGDDMAERIRDYCVKTKQGEPTLAEILRCIYDSLSVKIKETIAVIEKISGKTFKEINIFGGGSQSALLCQTVADLTRKTVHSGPVEASCVGNAAAQFIANGHIKDVNEAKTIIRNSFDIKIYQPM